MGESEFERYNRLIDLIVEQHKKMDAFTALVPHDHIEQHEAIKNHLAQSPAPKEHGDHHSFVAGMQKHVGSVIDILVKTIGYSIAGAFALGVIVWVANVGIPQIRVPALPPSMGDKR